MGKRIVLQVDKNKDKKICKRCEKHEEVNEMGLCKKCAEDVEYEYSLLYMSEARFMEY